MPTLTRTRKAVVAVTAIGVVAVTAAACSSDAKPVANLPSIPGGTTSVKLDSSFLSALTSLGLRPGVVNGAKLDATTGAVTFPITGGHVKIYKKGDVNPYVQGEIDHSGGLTLTKGATTVTLDDFKINPGKNAYLKGDVLVNGKTAATQAFLFDLHGGTLKPITIDATTGVATLTGTTVDLTTDADTLLDKTFATTALKGAVPVGVATLLVDSKPKV